MEDKINLTDEEVVKKVASEVENSIKEAGEQAVFDLGLHGMHPESIQAALIQLHDADIIAVQQHGEESAFTWPALDAIVFIALQEASAPKTSIVGVDGEKLR